MDTNISHGENLTGKKVQEYTNATTTGLVNAKTHEWDWDIIQALGLKKELFGDSYKLTFQKVNE